jgi:predicted ATPase/DNA-binding CsgD family transcriptional regulator
MGDGLSERLHWAEGSGIQAGATVQEWRPRGVPTQPGPLIGREWEQKAIQRSLLQADVRLLTLWGPAGIGKTRLALTVAVAPEVVAEFQDGVVFVDLTQVDEPTAVMPALADALGLDQVDAVIPYLQNRRLLLVLDNLEHVLDGAPELAPLLVSCPSVKILATSRAALRLRWEHAFPVAPLAVPHSQLPTDAQSAASYAGIALFVERARAARPDFRLTDDNARAVAEVCTRLEGLPLALELAASRIKGLPLLVLLARLEEGRLELLQGGAPDLPARQQTLRRALAWSYDLLDEHQQTLFRRLGVFVDGCTPEAAEAVCGGGEMQGDVLEGLAVLVHTSLLRLEEPPGGHPRYTMLATVRDYSVDRLGSGGEARETRARHAAYYLGLADEAEAQLPGAERTEWLERLEREHGNLRAGLQWTIESGQPEHGLRIAVALSHFWSMRGHLTEGREWLRVLLDLSTAVEGGPARAGALAAAGTLAQAEGDPNEAMRLHEQSLELRRQTGDLLGIAASLHSLGALAHDTGDLSRARSRFEESLATYQALGDPVGTSVVLQELGSLELDQGDLDGGRVALEESLAICRASSDLGRASACVLGLARLALRQNDLNGARSMLEEALGLVRQVDDDQGIASVLEGFACVAARRNAPDRALRLVGAAECLREAKNAGKASEWSVDLEAAQAAAHEALGQAQAEAALAEGQALSLEQALELCREDEPSARSIDVPQVVLVNGCLEELTRREREVIELAVRGWSNRQIANELVISERTAEGHIHNILGKLQLESRSQLAAWGVRAGLIKTDEPTPSGSASTNNPSGRPLTGIQVIDPRNDRPREAALRP